MRSVAQKRGVALALSASCRASLPSSMPRTRLGSADKVPGSVVRRSTACVPAAQHYRCGLATSSSESVPPARVALRCLEASVWELLASSHSRRTVRWRFVGPVAPAAGRLGQLPHIGTRQYSPAGEVCLKPSASARSSSLKIDCFLCLLTSLALRWKPGRTASFVSKKTG